MDYASIKLLHQAAVLFSITGFLARGLGSLSGAAWARGRAARTVPHVVDTVLLLSALALAWTLRLDPRHAPWLMAKLLALLVYIGLGMVALKPRFSTRQRTLAFIAAVVTFGYIVSVATTKQPGGFLVSASG